MSQSSDSSDQDIPVLTDVMVTGHDPHAKTKRSKRHGHGHDTSHAQRHEAAQGDDAHREAHEEAHEGAHEDAHEAAHEAPRERAHEPTAQEDDVPVLDSVYEPALDDLPGEPAMHPELEGMTAHAQQAAHDEALAPAREPAQFVPGEAEFTSGSAAERYVAPPDLSAAHTPTERIDAPADTPEYDADVLAERLRARFATYLKGEGRNLIEARCRDAFQDHTTWLVNQITREVALALETEMLRWVREAIREELGNSADGK
ncbi:conserved hypothetical protein [Paraburkholderia piptadeniae]|uniref:DUF2486 family protein n=1 Tax=Paraburkholderia piptadeniae TaxID=1701573 RepID=A0A1N7RYS5_9BURK|nr:DUF2486 family protein [Paraburkholderia piptadeniae]SIT40278.1 conserved hypothetical protein [Paraburkholderia piptadeniae]